MALQLDEYLDYRLGIIFHPEQSPKREAVVHRGYLLAKDWIIQFEDNTQQGWASQLHFSNVWDTSEDHILHGRDVNEFMEKFEFVISTGRQIKLNNGQSRPELKDLKPCHMSELDSARGDCTIMTALLDARDRRWSGELLKQYLLGKNLPVQDIQIKPKPTGGFEYSAKSEGNGWQRVSLAFVFEFLAA